MDSKLTAQAVNLYLKARLQEDIQRLYAVTHAIETSTDTRTEKPKEIVLVYRQYSRNTPTAGQIEDDRKYFDSINPTKTIRTAKQVKQRKTQDEKEQTRRENELKESNRQTASATMQEVINLDEQTRELYDKAYELVCAVLKATVNAPEHKMSTAQREIADSLRKEINQSLCKSLTGTQRNTDNGYKTTVVTWQKYLDASGLNFDDLIQTAVASLIEHDDRKIAQNEVSAYIRLHAKRIDGSHLYIDEPENYGEISNIIDVTADIGKMIDSDCLDSIFNQITQGCKKVNISIFTDRMSGKTWEQIGKRHKVRKNKQVTPMTADDARGRYKTVVKSIVQNVKKITGAKTTKEAYKALKQALIDGHF